LNIGPCYYPLKAGNKFDQCITLPTFIAPGTYSLEIKVVEALKVGDDTIEPDTRFTLVINKWQEPIPVVVEAPVVQSLINDLISSVADSFGW
jgi:hypothetical protein